MTRIRFVAPLVALVLVATLLAYRSGAGDVQGTAPAMSISGTFYVPPQPETRTKGLYLVDPEITYIGERPFLTGKVGGINDGTRDTEFSGGRGYVAIDKIFSLQQVPGTD